jgi:hypothetical protein
MRGFWVNLTNPKGIIFFAAILPQFIDVARPQLLQYAILAATTFAWTRGDERLHRARREGAARDARSVEAALGQPRPGRAVHRGGRGARELPRTRPSVRPPASTQGDRNDDQGWRSLPEGTLQEFIEVEGNGCSVGPNTFKVEDLVKGKKIAIFALPGAFTPDLLGQARAELHPELDALKARAWTRSGAFGERRRS